MLLHILIKRTVGFQFFIFIQNLFLQLRLVIAFISLHSSSHFGIDVGVALPSKVIGADAPDTSFCARLLQQNQ